MQQTDMPLKNQNSSFVKLLWRVLPHTFLRQTHFLEFVKVLENKKVNKFLDPRSGEIILDVACGICLQTSRIAMLGSTVVGLDLVRDKIHASKWMNAYSNLQLLVADATMLPFRPLVFHKVVSVCALEHIVKDQEALTEMNRIAKTNATLVLSVDSFSYKETDPIQRIHCKTNSVSQYYSLPSLQNKLERSGFKIESAEFYVNSSLPAFFFKIEVLCPIISRFLFPLSLALSSLSQHFIDRRTEGYFLCVKARKKS